MAKKNLAEMFGHNHSQLEYVPDKTFVLPTCVVGVELELENILDFMFKRKLATEVQRNNRDASPYKLTAYPLNNWWELHQDGSLREGGIEFVSHQLFGKDLLNGITSLESFLKTISQEVKINASKRCSLHVHLDFRDFSTEEIVAFYTIYAIFERPLFRYIAKDRINNPFTIPLFRLNQFSDLLGQLYYHSSKEDGNVMSAMQNFDSHNRYSAVNLNALIKYGSIEFRHSKAMYDSTRIIEWINLLMCLKKFAINNTPERIIEYAKTAPTSDLVNQVFGSLSFIFNSMDFFDLSKEIKRGMRVARKMYIQSQLYEKSSIEIRTQISPEQIRKGWFVKDYMENTKSFHQWLSHVSSVLGLTVENFYIASTISVPELHQMYLDASVRNPISHEARVFNTLTDMIKRGWMKSAMYLEGNEEEDDYGRIGFDRWLHSNDGQIHLAHLRTFSEEEAGKIGFYVDEVEEEIHEDEFEGPVEEVQVSQSPGLTPTHRPFFTSDVWNAENPFTTSPELPNSNDIVNRAVATRRRNT